jgi:uncharacterized phage protein (TIGR01671 family)
MMREFKFRAWLLKENKIYGGAFEIIIDNPLFDPIAKHWKGDNRPSDSYLNHTLEGHKKRSGGDDFIIMQYTGLKDIDLNEIYEGDILCRSGNKKNYSVSFDKGCFVANGYNGSVKVSPELKNERYAIIGNIYENPELLSL